MVWTKNILEEGGGGRPKKNNKWLNGIIFYFVCFAPPPPPPPIPPTPVQLAAVAVEVATYTNFCYFESQTLLSLEVYALHTNLLQMGSVENMGPVISYFL